VLPFFRHFDATALHHRCPSEWRFARGTKRCNRCPFGFEGIITSIAPKVPANDVIAFSMLPCEAPFRRASMMQGRGKKDATSAKGVMAPKVQPMQRQEWEAQLLHFSAFAKRFTRGEARMMRQRGEGCSKASLHLLHLLHFQCLTKMPAKMQTKRTYCICCIYDA
jgi:hypothetical protein